MPTKEQIDLINKTTWEKLAIAYEERFMKPVVYQESYDRLISLIPVKNAKILEIGCGPGNISQYLLQHRPDIKLIGIDFADSMIELAKKNNPFAEFYTMDCRQIELLKSHFDVIVCGFCIPYISTKDVVEFIASCSRIIHSKSPFYLSFIAGNPSDSSLEMGRTGDSCYVYYHSPEEIVELLAANHFHLDQKYSIPYVDHSGISRDQTIIICMKT